MQQAKLFVTLSLIAFSESRYIECSSSSVGIGTSACFALWFVVCDCIECPASASRCQSAHVPLNPGLFFFTQWSVMTNHVSFIPSSSESFSHQSWSGLQLSSIVIEQHANLSPDQRQTSASPGFAGHTRSVGVLNLPPFGGFGRLVSCSPANAANAAATESAAAIVTFFISRFSLSS